MKSTWPLMFFYPFQVTVHPAYHVKRCLVRPWRLLSCSWLFDLLKSPPLCWWLPQPCDKSEPQKTPKPPHFARVRKVSLERLGEDFFNQLRARVASSSSGSSSLRPLIVAMGTRGDAARLKVGPGSGVGRSVRWGGNWPQKPWAISGHFHVETYMGKWW